MRRAGPSGASTSACAAFCFAKPARFSKLPAFFAHPDAGGARLTELKSSHEHGFRQAGVGAPRLVRRRCRGQDPRPPRHRSSPSPPAASTRPIYTPHVDTGDYIVVINAEKIRVTGNKLEDKMYYRHTGYIGNLKTDRSTSCSSDHPERVIEIAVKGMLPKNPLGRADVSRSSRCTRAPSIRTPPSSRSRWTSKELKPCRHQQ